MTTASYPHELREVAARAQGQHIFLTGDARFCTCGFEATSTDDWTTHPLDAVLTAIWAWLEPESTAGERLADRLHDELERESA